MNEIILNQLEPIETGAKFCWCYMATFALRRIIESIFDRIWQRGTTLTLPSRLLFLLSRRLCSC